MPIVVAIGALVVAGLGIWLFSGSASAAEGGAAAGGGAGSRTGGGGTGGTTGGVKTVIGIKLPEVPASEVSPFPVQGRFYQIKEGDTGGGIALAAYGSDRPYATWLSVAVHASNRVRLARIFQDWFLPRWNRAPSPVMSTWAGSYTGQYAIVFLPMAGAL